MFWVHLKRIVSDSSGKVWNQDYYIYVCNLCSALREQRRTKIFPHSELPKPCVLAQGYQRKRAF